GKNSETWLNEMLSEVAVDLVSRKIGRDNEILPKRLAGYLKRPWDSLTGWRNSVNDYYAVAAFGSYLLRHYAGSGSSGRLARNILHNPYTGTQAITSKVGSSWDRIVRGWGEQTLDKYRETSDLTELNMWREIKNSKNETLKISGIPMFYLGGGTGMSYFGKDGSNKGGLNAQNTISFPEPGGHTFVYLGKPVNNTHVNLSFSTADIRYKIVAH
ncbi:MAG: hypothetical protein AAF975_07885, partial [Spirochaetota bacterium]